MNRTDNTTDSNHASSVFMVLLAAGLSPAATLLRYSPALRGYMQGRTQAALQLNGGNRDACTGPDLSHVVASAGAGRAEPGHHQGVAPRQDCLNPYASELMRQGDAARVIFVSRGVTLESQRLLSL